MKKCNGKVVIVDNNRNVDSEMALCGFRMEDVISILDDGFVIKKRKQGIFEKWLLCGRRIHIAVVEECEDYWLLRHVGNIRASRKKLKLIRGDK